MKDVVLAMRPGRKLELVSYIGYSRLFFIFCDNNEIVIQGLNMRYPIYIHKYGDYHDFRSSVSSVVRNNRCPV